MPNASFVQTTFLGGEWSQHVQGRMESDRYKTAMNVCLNGYPVEEGSWHRRQGTRYLAHTKAGAAGKVMDFDFSVEDPYQMEFTDGFMRFFRGSSLVFTDPLRTITTISTATPAVVTTSTAHGWSNNDTVMFNIAGPPCRATILCNRQFIITVLSGTTFSIADALTGDAIDGNTITYATAVGSTDSVLRVLELATPYTSGKWADLRKVQDATSVLLLRGATQPYTLAEGGTFFALTAQTFTDGPYLDENTTTTTLDPTGVSGSVTVVASSITGINDNTGFQTTDVGRLIRLRSAPVAWSNVTTYAVGDTVTGSDDVVYASMTASNLNHNPVSDAVNWSVSGTSFVWSAARITARASTTSVTVTIEGTALINANATTHWRLGVYSDTTGWPTCGTLHEGRLWLGGVVANRIDGSMSGKHYNFTPTADDGTVQDNHAVSAVADAPELSKVLWLETDEQGLIIGTQSGPWRVRASANDDTITPASIQERKVLGVGCADVEAVRAERTLLYVQRHKRKVLEFGYFQEVGGYHAPNLTKTASHMTVGGIEEIRWQLEPQPMIWGRRADGVLLSCAYKRDPDEFYAAWAKHTLASDRLCESLSIGPSPDGLGQNLYMVTNDPDTNVRWVEQLSDFFDDSKADWEFDFVDHSVTPCCAEELSDDTGVRIFGLWHLNGATVDPMIGGIDLGSYTVSNGVIVVPYNTAIGFTQALLQSFSDDFGAFSLCFDFGAVPGAAVTISAVSIMEYVGPDTGVVGVSGFASIPDWTNNALYCVQTAGGTTSGLRKFTLDPSGVGNQSGGDETLQRARDSIGVPALTISSGGAFMLSKDGEWLTFVSNSSNSMILAQVQTSDLTKVDEFGVASSSLAPSTDTRILSSQYLVPVQAGSSEYIISGTIATTEEVCLLPQTSGGMGPNVNMGTLTEAPALGGVLLGPGLSGSSQGQAHALGLPFRNGVLDGDNALNMGVYTIYSDGSFTRVGQFKYSDIDATWTHVLNARAMAYDSFDGHLLVMVSTDDVVANTGYIMKVNASTGVIIWKLAIPAAKITPYSWSMAWSRIINSTYLFIVDSDVWVIDTSAGTKTTVALHTVGVTGPQYSDDISNSVVFYGNFTAGSPAPAYLGTRMGSGGDHSGGTHWYRVFVGTISGQPRRALTNIAFCAPAIIGQTYTSRGQLLRPDHGQDAGAANGPAFGKIRRIHQYGASVYRTRGLTFGLDFAAGRQFAAPLKKANGAALDPGVLYSGTFTDKLDSKYDFDNKIAWEITRPYPAIVTVVAGYDAAQDK